MRFDQFNPAKGNAAVFWPYSMVGRVQRTSGSAVACLYRRYRTLRGFFVLGFTREQQHLNFKDLEH